MTIIIPEWIMWCIAMGALITAGLSTWEFIERQRLKNDLRSRLKR